MNLLKIDNFWPHSLLTSFESTWDSMNWTVVWMQCSCYHKDLSICPDIVFDFACYSLSPFDSLTFRYLVILFRTMGSHRDVELTLLFQCGLSVSVNSGSPFPLQGLSPLYRSCLSLSSHRWQKAL